VIGDLREDGKKSTAVRMSFASEWKRYSWETRKGF
jgi:hypothetical protein